MIRSALTVALLVLCHGVRFELATIFSSGAILQRDKPLKVWGFATPGLPLFLTLAQYDDPANNTVMSATTGTDGIVVFTGPAFPASTSPYDLYLSTAPFNWPSGNGSFIHYSFLYIGDGTVGVPMLLDLLCIDSPVLITTQTTQCFCARDRATFKFQ